LDDMLRSLAMLTVQIMEVDLCVIMLLDQAHGRLMVRASSPNLNDRATSFRPIDVDRQVWEKLRDFSSSGQFPEMSTHALERLNPLKDSHYRSLLSLPLIAGTEHLGLINCYSSKTRRYSAEDSTLLSTIANQVALAIKNSHLVDLLAQKNLVKGFIDDLMQGTYDSEDSLRQRANFLGCDLFKPHAIVTIEIAHLDASNSDENGRGTQQSSHFQNAPVREGRSIGDGRDESAPTEDRLATHKRISGQLRRRLQDNYPGSLVYERENLLTCIVCLIKDPSGARLKTWLRDLSRQMRNEHKVRLSSGIGNTCSNAGDYRRGFAESNEASQMGQSL